jgi:NAD(P)-dependent dehydrogenase (short-subunit alcohol dehydrogenase family)
MKTIVITGSTRGIGYGLADAFLAQGCVVTVSGRTEEAVERAVASLSREHTFERVLGHTCDVTQFHEVRSLWDAARGCFGKVDIWINNAGVAHPQMKLWEFDPEILQAVVDTNLLGAMHGAHVALGGMLAQGFGSLYNMEGFGSDGRRMFGLTPYGTTKYGLAYLTDTLVEETAGTGLLVGALRPGMVATELLSGQFEGRPEDWERAKRIFNILADRAETVAPWLARKVLENTRSGVRFQWLTRHKLIARFLTAPFRKRDVFADYAER